MGHDKITAAIETEVSKRKRRNTMKRRILLVLLALALCFGITGCAQKLENADAKDFEVSYTLTDEKIEYRRGETINLRGDIKNVSNSTYTYLGQNYLMVRISVYCEKDGEVYHLKENPYEVTGEEPWKCELAAGETTGAATRFVVQEDAPLGSYHVRVYYEDFEQVFENVLTITE